MNIEKTNKILNTFFNVSKEWDGGFLSDRCSISTGIGASLPPAMALITLSTGDDRKCHCERSHTMASMPLPDFLQYISETKEMIEEFLHASKDTIHELPPEILEEVWRPRHDSNV